MENYILHNTDDEQDIAYIEQLETYISNSEIPSWMSDMYG